MRINNFEKFTFNNSEIRGIKLLVNFSLKNNVEIILHEETQDKYQQLKSIDVVKSFPPLLFSVDIDSADINSLNIPKEVNTLTLLDGHHRLEHLSLYKYDHPVPVVLIANQDVSVESYNSEINTDEDEFVDTLLQNNYNNLISSEYCITFQNTTYVNEDVKSIYDLYDFKRKLIKQEIITPVQNDSVDVSTNIVDFTPIKLEEFYKEKYLFPPKSTWISPRI
tara:strand:- start:274 stop:939 length:666 start_codon:yes stop_codon:yes gene_type:complete